MTSKAAIKLGREILDRFFREAEGKTENKIDLAFVLGDMDLTYDKAEEALEYLSSRGLVKLFGSDTALLLEGGVNAVIEDKDIGKLPKYQPEWPARGSASSPAPGPAQAAPAAQPVPPRPLQRPPVPTLTCTDPEGNVSTVVLGWMCSIGRAAENTVPLNDRRASKRHAEITFQGDHYALRDLGSANGTMLNGAYIDARPLQNGDIVLVGHSQLVYGCPHVLPRPAGAPPEGMHVSSSLMQASPAPQPAHAPPAHAPPAHAAYGQPAYAQAAHAQPAHAQGALHGPGANLHGMPATPSQLPRRAEHNPADDLAATALRPEQPPTRAEVPRGKPIEPPSARMDRIEAPSARMEPPSAHLDARDLDEDGPTIARPSPMASLRHANEQRGEEPDWPDEVSGTVDEGARVPPGVQRKPVAKPGARTPPPKVAAKPPQGAAVRIVKGQPARPPPADDLLGADAYVTEPPVTRDADLFSPTAGVHARDLLGDTPAPIAAQAPALDPALLEPAHPGDDLLGEPSRRADQDDLFKDLTGQKRAGEDDLFAPSAQRKEEEEPLELEERAGDDLFPARREPSFAGLAQPKPKREQLIASQLDQDLLGHEGGADDLFSQPPAARRAPEPEGLELEPIAPTRPLEEDELTSLARGDALPPLELPAAEDLVPPLEAEPPRPEPPPVEEPPAAREAAPRGDTVAAPPHVIEEALRAPDPFDESTPVSPEAQREEAPAEEPAPEKQSHEDLVAHAAELPDAPVSLDAFSPPPPAAPMEEGEGATPVPPASRFEQTLVLLRQHAELAPIEDRERVIEAIDLLSGHPLVKSFLAELPEP